MNLYIVRYSGNSSRFKGFSQEVYAESEREAVIKIYSKYLNENYFPQDNGNIEDCEGYVICSEDETAILFDGGYFGAQLIEK